MTDTNVVLHRDKRATIVGLPRRSSAALTAPQIIARAGPGRVAVARQLAALGWRAPPGGSPGGRRAGTGAPARAGRERVGDGNRSSPP
ncbi:MAG TPA: hypothetical protein VIL85_12990 [Thermomicrobiales bacterium]